MEVAAVCDISIGVVRKQMSQSLQESAAAVVVDMIMSAKVSTVVVTIPCIFILILPCSYAVPSTAQIHTACVSK